MECLSIQGKKGTMLNPYNSSVKMENGMNGQLGSCILPCENTGSVKIPSRETGSNHLLLVDQGQELSFTVTQL